MSAETEEKKESAGPSLIENPAKRSGYQIGYDSHRQDFMILQIPLKEIAENMAQNADRFGTMVNFRGFFAQVQCEAEALISKHIEAMQRSGIIKPGQRSVPGLRVH